MADEPAAPKKSKRRLRAPTETFRERAATMQLQGEQPSKQSARRDYWLEVWRQVGWPIRFAGRWIGRIFKFIFNRQPFIWLWKTILRRVLRWLGIFVIGRYLLGSWQELRMTTWPDRRTSLRLTGAVIIFALVFGAIIAVVDFGLDIVFRKVFIQ